MMLDYSASTMRRYLKEIVEMGFLDERTNPNHKWDRTLQYRPNILKIQNALLQKGYSLDGYALPEKDTLPFSIMKNGGSILENRDTQNERAIPEITTDTITENIISPNGGNETQTAEGPEKAKASSNGNNSQAEIDAAVSEILDAWGRLFPGKSQPRPTTYRKKIATRWGNAHFRENWLEAMELAAASPTCQRKSWFRFEFFVRNDENYQKCLDRWMSDFDAKLDNPHTNGRSSSITAPKEMDYDKTPDGAPTRFMTAANFTEFAEGIKAQ